MHTIGERIRAERLRLGLTQLDLAKVAGVTKAAISALERGTSKNPRPETLVSIAARLGVNITWLVNGSGPRLAGPISAAHGKINEDRGTYERRAHLKNFIDSVDKTQLDALWEEHISPGELHPPVTPNKRTRMKRAS
jgi:transcriptional regulator with XRE-family HTH domain